MKKSSPLSGYVIVLLIGNMITGAINTIGTLSH